MPIKPKVAFVCVHNSCRSQIAEALGKKLASDVFISFSAGTEIKSQMNQDAVRLIKEIYGIDMEEAQQLKPLSALPPVDIVVTTGCDVHCPYLPSKQREEWELADPTGKSDEEFRIIIAQIEGKVLELKKRIEIQSSLKTAFIGHNLHYYSETDSTNEAAKRQALVGAAEGTVIVADQQKQGKGRLERNWFSPPAQGLWFSIILRPQIKPTEATQLTFVSAVAVCKAIRSLTGLPVMIKWPNDLLCGNKKVCGILTELSTEMDDINFLVVGIGLNVNQREEDFPIDIKETASSLFIATGRAWRRTEILGKILHEYESQYQNYLTKGFGHTLLLWRSLNTTLGNKVVVNTREERFTGVAEDINENGCLLIRKDSGETEVLLAGDVSLRKET